MNEESWLIELDGCEPTLAATVRMALEQVVEGHIDGLIRSGELS